jgi:hypothetical protein
VFPSIDERIRRAIRNIKAHDDIGLRSMWAIEKKWPWEKRPFETLIFPHNLPLNEGLNALFNLLCGAAETAFNSVNANIGVGDSDTAVDASQTGLQGSNKLYKGMEAGYPQSGSSQHAVFRSKFASAEANFAWKEITVASGNSDSADNLNRKVQEMGTKVSPAEWYATLTIGAVT